MTVDIDHLIAEGEAHDRTMTGGPWRCAPCGNPLVAGKPCWCSIVDRGEDDRDGIIPSGAVRTADAAGIAWLRTNLPAMLAAIRSLRADVARLTAERDEAVRHRAETNDQIKKLHAVIKGKGMCVEDSVSLHVTRDALAAARAEVATLRALLGEASNLVAAIKTLGGLAQGGEQSPNTLECVDLLARIATALNGGKP